MKLKRWYWLLVPVAAGWLNPSNYYNPSNFSNLYNPSNNQAIKTFPQPSTNQQNA